MSLTAHQFPPKMNAIVAAIVLLWGDDDDDDTAVALAEPFAALVSFQQQ